VIISVSLPEQHDIEYLQWVDPSSDEGRALDRPWLPTVGGGPGAYFSPSTAL
jgi:hypothetical protein